MSYCAKIKKDDKGYLLVTFPSLPDCFTYGNNQKHAKEMAKDVLEEWLLAFKDDGLPIPVQRKHKCKDCVEIKLSPKVKLALGLSYIMSYG